MTSLIVLPTIVDAPGRYLTRAGEVVSVERLTRGFGGFGCEGHYPSGQAERWHRSGRLYFGALSDNDVVRFVEAASRA